MINKFKFVLILFLAVFTFNVQSSFAQYEQYNHPELGWETIETEHFLVHFHTGSQRTPRLIAKIAEEIYAPITNAYNFEPDGKIHFIVKDHDDYANGAAYYYDNKIEIWSTPLDFILRGTSDWLRDVLTHEFAHMIHLQTARKLSRTIPALYLQVLDYEDERRPDVLYGYPKRVISYPIAATVMPGWFAEGVAQHQTMLMENDRWDSHRDMILRTRVLNGKLYSLKEMGVFGKSSIGNESVYNQGFSFTNFLAENYGEEVINKISRNMASPIAVRIESAIKKATGVPSEEIFSSWESGLEERYSSQSNIVKQNSVEGQILEAEGAANIFSQWIDDSNIMYLSNSKSDYISNTSLYLHDISTNKRKRIARDVSSSPSYNKKTNTIVFSRIKKNSNNSHFFDLFLYDMNTKKEKRLTKSARATYPSFAPDGSGVYFVSANDGTSNLSYVDIATGNIKQLTRFIAGEELFVSSVSPDGKKILISVGARFGRDIAVINTDGSEFKMLMAGKEDDRNPEFSVDGSKFYYSSDRTGIYNIYEYDFASGNSKTVTNVIGGAFMPDVNADGRLVYSGYTADGYKPFVLNTGEYSKTENVQVSDIYEKIKDFNAEDDPDNEIPEYSTTPYKYKAMKTFILPRLTYDYGTPKLGLYAYSSDPLDKYTFFAGGSVNKDFDRDVFALLDYKKYKNTVFLELYNVTRHLNIFEEPYDYYDITLGYWEADLGIRRKLSETQEYQAMIAYGRQWSNLDVTVQDVSLRPLRYDYYKGVNFNLKWRYDAVLPRRDMEINPSYGRKIDIEYWLNADEIFEDFDIEGGMLNEYYKSYTYNKLIFNWHEYFGTPFILDRSALTFDLQGGFIDRHVDDFLNFFAGGITGIKGYSFYSIEGRNKLMGSLTYRFPVLKNIGMQVGPWYFDKMYASAGYQLGDAWNTKMPDISEFKRGIDLGIRLDMVSFYVYPTKIGFNVAYGLDTIDIPERALAGPANTTEGKNLKFFLTVLFGYDF